MRISRIIFVGQAPSEHGDPSRPLEGKAAEKIGGLLKINDFVESFARINLNAQFIAKVGKGDVFDMAEGYVAAKVLLRGSWTRYVLCGQKVAQCFGIKSDFLETTEVIGKRFFLLPHPSGINRWWNDPENVRKAKEKLEAFLWDAA